MEEKSDKMVQGFAVAKIYTRTLTIVGKVMVTATTLGNLRLAHFLNLEEVQFVLVQDATVLSVRDKKPVAKKTSILLNKSQITWVIPIKEPEIA